MNLLVSALTLAMAGIFLGAAAQKVLDLGRFFSTLEQLGFSALAARRVAPMLVLAEVLASLGLIFQRESVFTFTLVIALSSSFAAAGLIAIIRKRQIKCGCFGAYGNGTLGAPQLWSFPIWLVATLLSWSALAVPSVFGDQATGFAIVCLILASLGAVRSVHLWREARGDRLSAKEMYVWLQ
jgi:hypothetical protein